MGTDKAVHDSISLRNNGKKYGAVVAKATVTLNYSASTDGKTADKKPSKATGAIQVAAGKTASADSPDFTPADLGMKSWQPGRYWFDLSVDEKDLSVTGTARYETSDVGNVARLSGLTDSSEQWTITPTSAPTISTRAMAGDARVGGTQKVHDSITIANPDPNRAITVAKVTTTLHMKMGNRKASKTVGPVTIPAGGSKTFDSADFAPSDLKRGTWGNTGYWFDATVSAADVTYPSGAQALSADLVHDGRNDKAQSFNLTWSKGGKDFATKAQETFSTAGGTSSVHDRLNVVNSEALVNDLSVKVTLNWASSPTATKAEASAAKTDTVPAGSAYKDLPGFAPSDLRMTTWKAGRYWYDVLIPVQEGVGEDIPLDGLDDADQESWTAVTPFGLNLAKLAYIGQPGQGRWSNEPVKGAVFTLTETADASGSTAKPGTSPRTVTTDANGSAHLLDGTIAPLEVRWFKLVETKAPSSYKGTGSGTYWMIKATGTPDGATISATGSNEEAKALLKGLDGSTVTVGNRLEGNIMPPMTGGRYDVARAGALTGVVTLGLLIAGCVVLRRRNTSPLDR